VRALIAITGTVGLGLAMSTVAGPAQAGDWSVGIGIGLPGVIVVPSQPVYELPPPAGYVPPPPPAYVVVPPYYAPPYPPPVVVPPYYDGGHYWHARRHHDEDEDDQ